LDLIESGVMTMRQMPMSLGTLCVFLVGLAAPSDAQPTRNRGACGQITAACEGAGFTPGAGQQGAGLQVDCIVPIMQGTGQPRRARKPLPQVDPQLVADCKASNPRFGQGRVPPSEPPAQPLPASPPPPAATQNPQPQSAAGKRPNIVFILTDDLALNLVQYMPNVLKMEQEGVTFANYFVTDSLCCPSRTSIFTGRYPHDTGIFTNTGNDGGFKQTGE
jgi:hypothetical protein